VVEHVPGVARTDSSHDTLGRLFRHLDPEVFEASFRQWIAGLQQRIAAVLHHIALNLLCQDAQTRLGIHRKRLKAGRDTDYLARLLIPEMRSPWLRGRRELPPTSLN